MKNKALLNSNSFLVFFFFTSFSIFSQTVSTFSPKINIPSSPEAALLGRFGDIPVGYYTGTADISIPIYTIKEAGIEIPIQLRYHSSGVKVADDATWAGLGWDLSPGGSIIQEVRGKRDDMDGFYSTTLPANYSHLKNIIVNQGYPATYRTLKHRCYASGESDNLNPIPGGVFPLEIKNLIDQGGAQPDIYRFNFGNHSGSFYINYETKEIVQIDKSEEIIFTKTATDITAKTSDGIVFLFGVIEKAFNTDVSPDDVSRAGQTYKLSSITLTNGSTIDFSYIDATSANLTYQESYQITETCSGTNQTVKGLKTKVIENDIKVLSKITTNDVVIDFILEDRDDIVPISSRPNPKRLKAIDISYRSSPVKKIKTFELGYSYFPYDESIGNPSMSSSISFYNVNKDKLGKRLKLDTVKEVGYDQTSGNADRTKPAYRFEYDLTNTMPMKLAFAKDFWGYYNGIDNKTLLPDLRYFDYNYQLPYFQPTLGAPQITYSVPFNYANYQGVNRYTDNTKAGAYMLKKVYYPTGGFSEFEYEANSFSNQFIPDAVQLKNALKRTVLLNDSKGTYNINYHKDFKITNSTTISFTNTVVDGYTPFPNPNAPVYGYADFKNSRIVFSKTKQGVTTFIQQWKVTDITGSEFGLNHGKTWYQDIRLDYDPDPTVTYSIDVINELVYSGADTYKIANLKADFLYYDNTGVNTSISNQGGMRVKSIKNYASTGNMTNQKNLKYSEGKLLSKFEPLSAQETFCEFTKPDAVNGQLITTATVNNEISISSDNLVNTEGNLVGYGTVEEIDIDNYYQTLGKKVYQFYNYENLTSKNAPSIPNALNGLPTYESVYNKNNDLLVQKTNSYLQIGTDQYFQGIININQLSGLSSSCNDFYYPGMTDFSFVVYPIVSRTFKLQNVITKNYFNGNPVSTNEAYTYTSRFDMRTKTTTNSNDDQLSSTYYYATDYPDGLPIETTMVTANMTNIPLLTENRKNTDFLSRQKTQYAKDATTNNWILPKYIFAGKGVSVSATEKKVTYDKYDSRGNIQQYTLENGASVTILWGYNKTLPIAKIENATYSQIANALGITTTALDAYTETNLTAINTLRSNITLVNSPISTYSYLPLVGVSTITDPKGDMITYSYDALGRLINVKDKNNKILSENKYQYKN